MNSTACIFDLDNTLYDFIEFFGPAFRGMISAVSKETGVEKELLIENAKEVIAKRGYTEYAFLIREMAVFNDCSPDELLRIEKVASGSFSRVRKKRLVSYPHVENAMQQLFDGGVIIAAVTNAPLYQAYRRLESLNLLKYFSLIVAVDNAEVPDYVVTKGRAAPWINKAHLTTITFDRSLGKPNRHAYKLAVEALPNCTEYWVVGDNIGRDLQPAASLGYKTIWAEYGCKVDEKNYETVLKLTPAGIKKHETAKSDYRPDFIISSAIELLDIIPHKKQLDMFK